MKHVLPMLLILTLLFSFTACEEKIDPSDPAKDGVTNLADFIPGLYDMKMEVYSGDTDIKYGDLLNQVYVSGTEDENADLREYLMSLDLEGAEEIQFIGGSSDVPWLRFGFRNETDWYTACFCYVNRPEVGEFQSIIVYHYDISNGTDSETIMESSMQENTDRKQYKFPVGTFDLEEIDTARNVILHNTNEPDCSGTATYLEDGNTYALWYKNAALAQNILEGVLADKGTMDAMEIDADYEVVLGDATYLLDTETGNFSKAEDGETVYSNMSGFALPLRYNILTAGRNGVE